MNKALAFILIILITPLLAGVYGMLHDQFTYTICPEYYTRFKFIQFGLWDMGKEAKLENPRQAVAAVGFMATWWTGIPIGLIIGLAGLKHRDGRTMFKVSTKAILLILVIAAVTGITGLVYGWAFLVNSPPDWWLPENLSDRNSFIAVGSMHNFSYIGGLAGLTAGVIYSIRQRKVKRISA